MESYRDIYWRFIENYRTNTGGINIYPQFDSDLDALLEWLENDDAMGDWSIDGHTYLMLRLIVRGGQPMERANENNM